MKPGNVSSVSNNQAKWSNTQSKNFIINAVPVKNEVSTYYKDISHLRKNNIPFCTFPQIYLAFRLFTLKREHIAIRKCITTIDITLATKKQRDQLVGEQKDTEIKMHLREHCM